MTAPHLQLLTPLSTMSIFDYDDCDQEPEYLSWEDLGIEDQIEYLNRAWEDKAGESHVRDCDEGDYYSLSPNGDLIPW